MYTVLIMPKKTSDNMQQHYPVLKNALEAKNIGLCSWIQDGKNVETALPELYDLIGNNREWRAIVAMYDEESLGLLDVTNPFDYSKPDIIGDMRDDDEPCRNITLEDSENYPLIKLTHFLAGVPLPAREYELKQIQEQLQDEAKNNNDGERVATRDPVPFSVYDIKGGEAGRRRYEEVCDKYTQWNIDHKMNGISPAEIILVKTRDVAFRSDAEIIKQAWKDHTESDSSEFWRRNLYPTNSKFLLYDIEKLGMMYEERDSFKFWMALITLAGNDVASDILQPHKLYRLNTKINTKKLTNAFQEKIMSLNMARTEIIRSMEKGKYATYNSDMLPNYELEVPVNFHSIKSSVSSRNKFGVGLDGGITTNEGERWDAYTTEVYANVKELLKNVDRELEYSALGFRDKCEYRESDVKLLDIYAEEDLRNSIHDTYDSVIKSQNNLPHGVLKYDEEMQNADGIVKQDIAERMSASQISRIILGSTGIMAITIVPALLQESSQIETIIMIGIAVGAVLAGGIISIFRQRKKLSYHVNEFTRYFYMMSNELNKNAKLYKTFLGNVASHIHGASYLKIMDGMKQDAAKTVDVRKNHMGFIDELKERLALWGSALRLSLDLEAVDNTVIGSYSKIDFYNLYSLSLSQAYKRIPLNETGFYVDTPFDFVDELQINREEIYDDIR